jgi:signal transduction histidine kinase
MQEETLEQIWDELYINDLSRSDPASKGLGLSMVRKIVALHGGDITAASPGVGKGSVFIIRLPRFCVDNCEKSGTDI